MKYSLILATLFTTCAVSSSTIAPTVQYLKDCKIVQQRSMTNDEVTAYQQLQQAEEKMRYLQQPLDEMQARMKPHEQQMEQLSSKVESQAKQGDLDTDLIEEQQRVAEELSGTVEIFQKDIDRVEAFSAELEAKANSFSDLIQNGVAKNSFDQIRIKQSGDRENDCSKGVFFNKSIEL